MTTAAPQPAADPSARRLWTLGLLTLLQFCYLLDRNAIIIVQELIKREFALSDTQVGVLLGSVYGVSFAIAALPMGWLADRVNRRNLVVALLSIWSGLTALCAASTSYWHLALARVGVAASEAGGAPPALSILSDLFPPKRRATVASVFATGSGLGVYCSFLIGGAIAREWGWRGVFVAFGLPGLALALAIALTVREPARTMRPAAGERGMIRTSLALLRTPVLRECYLGTTLYSMSTAAVLGWITAYLMRDHGFGIAFAGALIAGSVGLGSMVGGVLTGLIADRVGRRSPGGTLWVVAAAAIVNMAAGLLALTATTLPMMMIGMAGFGLTVFSYAGTTNGVIGTVAPPGRRGLTFALYALVGNLLGGGLGPALAGALSDAWQGHGGLALRSMLAINLFAALAYVAAGRSLAARTPLAPGSHNL